MDEPTASLSVEEATRLHGIVRELAAAGTAIIFVSPPARRGLGALRGRHRLQGRAGDEARRRGADQQGRTGPRDRRPRPGDPRARPGARRHRGRPVLEVRGVSDGSRVRDVSLTVREGEVVGLGGLVGAGRTELVKLVYGARARDRGEVLLDGRPSGLPVEPADAVARGIGLGAGGTAVARACSSIGRSTSTSTSRQLDSLRRSRFWPLLRTAARAARERRKSPTVVTVKARDVVDAGRLALRRQPAEGGHRTLAARHPATADPRRAVAGRGRRRPGGGAPRRPRARRARHRGAGGLLGQRGTRRRSATACS